jgi:hypothetical protein
MDSQPRSFPAHVAAPRGSDPLTAPVAFWRIPRDSDGRRGAMSGQPHNSPNRSNRRTRRRPPAFVRMVAGSRCSTLSPSPRIRRCASNAETHVKCRQQRRPSDSSPRQCACPAAVQFRPQLRQWAPPARCLGVPSLWSSRLPAGISGAAPCGPLRRVTRTSVGRPSPRQRPSGTGMCGRGYGTTKSALSPPLFGLPPWAQVRRTMSRTWSSSRLDTRASTGR